MKVLAFEIKENDVIIFNKASIKVNKTMSAKSMDIDDNFEGVCILGTIIKSDNPYLKVGDVWRKIFDILDNVEVVYE
jgi:hypothetical protein